MKYMDNWWQAIRMHVGDANLNRYLMYRGTTIDEPDRYSLTSNIVTALLDDISHDESIRLQRFRYLYEIHRSDHIIKSMNRGDLLSLICIAIDTHLLIIDNEG